MNQLVPAEAFPPGETLLEELKEREWTQAEFAEIIGRTPKFVNGIIKGEIAITPRTAKEIGAALGTSAMLWLNLEAAYQLHGSNEPVPARITLQARLREKFAVREMVRRRWIEGSTDPKVIEAQILRFFAISSIDETPKLSHAAKKTGYPDDLNPPQQAWLFRVKKIAEAMQVRPYSEKLLREAIPQLKALLLSPDDITAVPRILADCGVRLVIVEHVPASKIDGVCFWLDRKSPSPVIGLSLRLSRIDNFWFVLRHEIEHILRGHGRDEKEAIVDRDFDTVSIPSIPEEERIANAVGADFCVPEEEMRDFILRHDPLFNKEDVVNFARRMQVHPGLVVGQLQRRTGRYGLFRDCLVPIRDIISPVAMTDGYGQVIQL